MPGKASEGSSSSMVRHGAAGLEAGVSAAPPSRPAAPPDAQSLWEEAQMPPARDLAGAADCSSLLLCGAWTCEVTRECAWASHRPGETQTRDSWSPMGDGRGAAWSKRERSKCLWQQSVRLPKPSAQSLTFLSHLALEESPERDTQDKSEELLGSLSGPWEAGCSHASPSRRDRVMFPAQTGHTPAWWLRSRERV